jgi:2Fe-2S ferredoxin
MPDNRDKAVTITVRYENELYTVETYPGEYRSLMMLIYDRICPEGFGECLGMGRCGTCLIRIVKSRGNLSDLDRNEAATKAKAGITDEAVRLACQIEINSELDGLHLEVEDVW